MREWIAFPVITAHLPLPYFRLWCSETLDNGQTHPPLLSHCWPLHKFLNHPKVSPFQFQMWPLRPPFTCLQGYCLSLSPDPFEQITALLKSKLDENSSQYKYAASLSQCLHPLQLPKLSISYFKTSAENMSPTPQKNLELLGNLAAVDCKKLLHNILLCSSLGFHPVIPPVQEHSSPRQSQSTHSCTWGSGMSEAFRI